MSYFIALLLLIAPISASPQNAGQSISQTNKPGNSRKTARHKKKVMPPAAPKPTESKADEPTESEPDQPAESKADKPTLQYNQTYGEDTSKPPTKQAHDAIDLINALSTAVVGVFTVVLAIVTYRQYRATRTAERAWIVQQAPGPPTRNPNGDYEIRWELENRGHTPAWVTSLGSAGTIVQIGQNLPDNPQYTMAGPFPPEGTVLSPEGKILRGLTIPFDDMAPVEQGQRILYVFGIVEYRDIFKAKHETRYCYRFKLGPTALDPSPRDFYVEGPSLYIRAT